jgi:hypothetical protein
MLPRKPRGASGSNWPQPSCGGSKPNATTQSVNGRKESPTLPVTCLNLFNNLRFALGVNLFILKAEPGLSQPSIFSGFSAHFDITFQAMPDRGEHRANKTRSSGERRIS